MGFTHWVMGMICKVVRIALSYIDDVESVLSDSCNSITNTGIGLSENMGTWRTRPTEIIS